MADDNSILLECRKVTKLFGDTGNTQQVLQKIREGAAKDEIQSELGAVVGVREASFDVKRGEFFVIMGLSGSGKSTLIRTLIRLIEPTDGEIIIDGEDVTKLNEAGMRNVRRNKVAMVFQHYGLLPHKTVLENAEYGLKTRGIGAEERREKAQSAIERVGLTGWENYRPSALSGGMQQRVGLARALSHDPDILLMDEPFSGLDPIVRRQMQQEFGRLQAEEHLTTILVTHDLDEALMLGDRIAIMRDGQIIQIATPDELVTNPADDYVASFVEGASPARFLVARSIMSEEPLTVQEGESAETVVASMRERKIWSAFVVDGSNKVTGVLSFDALNRAAQSGSGSITIGTGVRKPVTCDPDMAIGDLFPLVLNTRHPLAVVDDRGVLQGMITKNMLLESMAHDIDYDEDDVEAPSSGTTTQHANTEVTSV
ncbi:MAG: betaine/proline/choline family ABC transporter ATP-binding protein [Thermomicrobiaceae bacterium]